VTQAFLARLRATVQAAYADVVKDVLTHDFHKASRSAGVLSAIEEVLALPDTMVEELKDEINAVR